MIGYKYVYSMPSNVHTLIEIEVHSPYHERHNGTHPTFVSKAITPIRVLAGDMLATEFRSISSRRKYKLGVMAHESMYVGAGIIPQCAVSPGLHSFKYEIHNKGGILDERSAYVFRTCRYCIDHLVKAILKYGPISTWSYKTKRRVPMWPGKGDWERANKIKHKDPTKRKGHKSMRNMNCGRDRLEYNKGHSKMSKVVIQPMDFVGYENIAIQRRTHKVTKNNRYVSMSRKQDLVPALIKPGPKTGWHMGSY